MDKWALAEGAEAGNTIREELLLLERLLPNKKGSVLRPEGGGPASAKCAILWVLLKGDDGEISLHKSLFRRNESMTLAQWAQYMDKKVFNGTGTKLRSDPTPSERKGILKGAIIPGVNSHVQLGYELYAVIGYAISDSFDTGSHSTRYRARKAGRSRG